MCAALVDSRSIIRDGLVLLLRNLFEDGQVTTIVPYVVFKIRRWQ